MVCTRAVWSSLHEKYCNQWEQDVIDNPKLHTYDNFKVLYNVEDYVAMCELHPNAILGTT